MTLSDLLRRFDDVMESPDGWLVHCPAHNDTHQSLRLTVADTGKVLIRCRAGCETKDVVAALGLTMRDLATMTAGDAVPEHAPTAADVPASPEDIARLKVQLDRYEAAYPTDAARAVREYAADRFGIGDDDAARLGLGYAADLPGGPRLVVPFRDRDGVARGFQARSLDPDAAVRWYGPKSPDGANWAKVGFFPGASGWDEVLITEGPGDGLTGAAAGYDTICVRGAGLATNPAVIEAVLDMLGDREAIVCGDGDPSGQRFSTILAEELANAGRRVRVLPMPDGEDLTSWRESDPARFSRDLIKAIADADPVTSREAALLAWDEERYSLSDLGGARYLRDYIASIGSGVKHTPEAGFVLLENGVWRIDDRQITRTHAQAVADIVKRLAREAAELAEASQQPADKRRAGRLMKYALHAQTTRGLDAMLRELQAVQGVPASINDFDQHPDLLAVRNGVVDLRTGELKPHDPNLLISRRIDVDYEPDAACPRWERFLAEVFPDDPDMPGYMQRLVGYGITGRTDEQVFVIHVGGGANGKSVFTDTLAEVFRAITTTTPFSTFEVRPSGGIPNDLAALKGARLVMASEGEQGKRMAEAVLKRVTGRDLIAARFMRQEFFEFRPQFLLQLATNYEPNFRGQDNGLWRRVKLIHWNRTFAPHEQDRRLPMRLLEEAEGILAWAVRGAVEWYRRGLDDPQFVRRATDEFRATSNVLDGFLPGKYVFADDAKAVAGETLFHDFQAWAEEENLGEMRRWSRKAFYAALAERGLTKRQGGGRKTVFEGVRRASPTDDAPGEPAESPLAVSPTTDTTVPTPAITGTDLDSLL